MYRPKNCTTRASFGLSTMNPLTISTQARLSTVITMALRVLCGVLGRQVPDGGGDAAQQDQQHEKPGDRNARFSTMANSNAIG
jgi:hypothetical protein